MYYKEGGLLRVLRKYKQGGTKDDRNGHKNR